MFSINGLFQANAVIMPMKFKTQHIIFLKSPLNLLGWNSADTGLVESFQWAE